MGSSHSVESSENLREAAPVTDTHRGLSEFWKRVNRNSNTKLFTSPDDSITQSEFCVVMSTRTVCSSEVFSYLSCKKDLLTEESLAKQLETMICKAEGGMSSYNIVEWEQNLSDVGIDANCVLSVIANACMMYEDNSLSLLVRCIPEIPCLFDKAVVNLFMGDSTIAINLSSSELPTQSVVQRNGFSRILQVITGNPLLDGTRLFATAADGFSFGVLATSLRYYKGNVIVVIEDAHGRVFGFYASRDCWEEAGTFDESCRDTLLFQIIPDIRIRRVSGRGSSNCLFFNSSSKSGCPVGLGLGGRLDAFRFWIDGTNFRSARVMDMDATFQAGQLLFTTDGEASSDVVTEIYSCEVWGFGGERALQEQEKSRLAINSIREQRRSIKKDKLIETQFDRDMFFSKTFKHRDINS